MLQFGYKSDRVPREIRRPRETEGSWNIFISVYFCKMFKMN